MYSVKEEVVMFYNVENLYSIDLQGDGKGCASFYPKKWNKRRYANKIDKIGRVIRAVEEKTTVFPMLIGLAEIQGRRPLEDLLQKLQPSYSLGMIHYEGSDSRGMDVALFYDKTKLIVETTESIPCHLTEINNNPEKLDATRDVLYAKFWYGECVFHAFVLHLPSNRNRKDSREKRKYILNLLEQRISKINFYRESVMVLGDFNENPNGDNVVGFVNACELVNPFLDLFEAQTFSNFYGGQGMLFDQVLFSRNFFKEMHSMCFQNVMVFNSLEFSEQRRKGDLMPFRTFSGTRYKGGYSDHYPVIARFTTGVCK